MWRFWVEAERWTKGRGDFLGPNPPFKRYHYSTENDPMAEEEGFIRMYVRDFAHLASRAEAGADVEEALIRRIGEARSHAVLMDRRKSGDHLGAVTDRVREEAQRV